MDYDLLEWPGYSMFLPAFSCVFVVVVVDKNPFVRPVVCETGWLGTKTDINDGSVVICCH